MADDRRLYEQTGCSLRPHANTKGLALDGLKNHSVIEDDLSEIYMIKRLSENGVRQGTLIFLDIFNEGILGKSKQCTALLQDAGGFMKLHDLGEGG